ncbi:hypothetical protein HPB49_008264 [Dermacentor silvarum]|uniref:Uncharacterized protein n=1 Tax=Dermacentor silvarum TaxID=543639 RepID=A0ACB8DXV9_DERSI|nr:hypothetical protein HPB49_008264 [Dermacentor silvarum]
MHLHASSAPPSGVELGSRKRKAVRMPNLQRWAMDSENSKSTASARGASVPSFRASNTVESIPLLSINLLNSGMIHPYPLLVRMFYKVSGFFTSEDGAPEHQSKSKSAPQLRCRALTPDFIPAEEWPAIYTYPNPVDFCLWAILEKEAPAHQHSSMVALKALLEKNSA